MNPPPKRNVRGTDDNSSPCIAHLHTERNNAQQITTLFSKVGAMQDKVQTMEVDLATQKQRQEHYDKDMNCVQDSISELTTTVNNNAKDVAKIMVLVGIAVPACTAVLVKLLQAM